MNTVMNYDQIMERFEGWMNIGKPAAPFYIPVMIEAETEKGRVVRRFGLRIRQLPGQGKDLFQIAYGLAEMKMVNRVLIRTTESRLEEDLRFMLCFITMDPIIDE